MADVKQTVEKIVGVNGNMITVEYNNRIMQNEVAFARVGDAELKCEVIRVRGKYADLQVFESTNGLKVGDDVVFTGELLSIELGPGLLAQVYDGLQNPLKLLAEHSGFFLQRGIYLRALDRDAKWDFTPICAANQMPRMLINSKSPVKESAKTSSSSLENPLMLDPIKLPESTKFWM